MPPTKPKKKEPDVEVPVPPVNPPDDPREPGPPELVIGNDRMTGVPRKALEDLRLLFVATQAAPGVGENPKLAGKVAARLAVLLGFRLDVYQITRGTAAAVEFPDDEYGLLREHVEGLA